MRRARDVTEGGEESGISTRLPSLSSPSDEVSLKISCRLEALQISRDLVVSAIDGTETLHKNWGNIAGSNKSPMKLLEEYTLRMEHYLLTGTFSGEVKSSDPLPIFEKLNPVP